MAMDVFKKNAYLFFLIGIVIETSVAFSANQTLNTSLVSTSSHFLSSLPWFKRGHAVLQLGGYWSTAGSQQQINIRGLTGDKFTVTSKGKSNGLVGWGYFIDGQEKEHFKMVYGLNAFYLPQTGVSGDVIQENMFTNLSYHYQLTHYPIYAVAKSIIKTKWPHWDATLDLGVGPNFMRAHGFYENALDVNTLPDTIFSSRTTTAFTVMLGAGIKINQFFGKAPLECGYRFFYLNKGQFNPATNQVINTLTTGEVYANAVLCSITV